MQANIITSIRILCGIALLFCSGSGRTLHQNKKIIE